MRQQFREQYWAGYFFKGPPSWNLFVMCLIATILFGAGSLQSLWNGDPSGAQGLVATLIVAVATVYQWRRLRMHGRNQLTEKRQ